MKNFNALRKSNVHFETNKIAEYSPTASQMVGYQPPPYNLKNSNKFPGTADFYTSADGCQYKKIESDGMIQTTIDYPKNALHIPGEYHELYRHSAISEEIPQNIRHKFGTRDTHNLLRDQVRVHDTLSVIQNAGIIKKVDKSKQEDFSEHKQFLKTQHATSNKNEDYLDLGNYLRHAVCHGYPLVNSKGTTFYDYTPEINKEFLSDKSNYTSPYRRTKDQHGRWVELCIVDTKREKELRELAKKEEKK